MNPISEIEIMRANELANMNPSVAAVWWAAAGVIALIVVGHWLAMRWEAKKRRLALKRATAARLDRSPEVDRAAWSEWCEREDVDGDLKRMLCGEVLKH